MKKIFLILFCLFSYSLFSQQTGVGLNWSCLGNVSIGTTSATAKLNVVGASILNGNITSKAGIYFQERFGDSALFDIHGTDYQSSATMGIGSRAGRKSQTSGGCTYVGSDAGYSNIGGDYNTYIGGASGYKNLSDANTFIGYDAGRYNINGQRNTIIGAEAGTLSTFNGSNNIFIGYNVAAKEKGSNKIYIDGYNSGADSTTSTIYADQKNHLINFYNKVSINGTANTSQTENLWVNGTMKLKGGATVDTIETTLTNSATNIPTSSAVFSELAGKASVSDSGMWTLNGTDIYSKNSGNVGIGITAPIYKLDVNGDSRFDGHVGLGGRTPSADKGVEYSENWELTSSSVEKIGAFFMPRFYATASGVEEPQVGLLGRAFLSIDNTQDWSSNAPIIGNEGSIYTDSGSTGTINSAISFYVHPLLSAYGANVTNHYGIKVQDPGGVGKLTNNYGVYISNLTSGTNNYSIYSAGGTNYFAGNVGIGTTAPVAIFHVKANKITANNDSTLVYNGRLGIGMTNPATKVQLYNSSTRQAELRIGSNRGGATGITDTMSGLGLLSASMSTTSKYTPAIKMLSSDVDLGVVKLLATINGRCTENYDGTTKGGMAIDFGTTPNTPGATSLPRKRMTIDQSGNVGINDSIPGHKLSVKNGYIFGDSTILNSIRPKVPATGAMYWHGDTLYIYNGVSWKFAALN